MKNLFLFCFLTLFLSFSCSTPSPQNKTDINVTPLAENDIPTSKALPKGMKLVWNDEFNGDRLDTAKWFTDYYSTLDYVYETNFDDFKTGNLPQPEIEFTGNSIILKVDENKPARAFWPNGRKISSIQTYDWKSDRNKMDNAVGGYFEARIKRNAVDSAKNVNIAFWFDSPGPDPRYFVEKGNNALGVEGIRPRGQVFEIDMCEYITTEIVLHGNVSPEGRFERNIGHHIVQGDFRDKWVTHSMLWTPAGLKFYIDGELVREWWDANDIKSPNHLMNMFFGSYGNDGTVTMEVDYVRYYQWDLEENNLLPNGNFEYEGNLFPWEGTGKIMQNTVHGGKYALELAPGDSVIQYVYLDHSLPYTFSYYGKGEGSVVAQIENIEQVTGISKNIIKKTANMNADYEKYEMDFQTSPEYGNHKRTVKATFRNNGDKPVTLDDIKIEKKQ